MKKIIKYQAISLAIICGGFFSSLLICVLMSFLFSINIYWLPVASVLCCPMISAIVRINVWINRKDLLTTEELARAKVYFMSAPMEILFSIVAACIFISDILK